MIIEQLYNQWCKETKRNGSVLVGSSIKEFFIWIEYNGYYLAKNNIGIQNITGESARIFIDEADKNSKSDVKIDFSHEFNTMKKIIYKHNFILRDDEEVKNCQIKGYKYILP